MDLHVNKKNMSLKINVKRAQDMHAEPGGDRKDGLNLHCRVVVMEACKSVEVTAKVHDALFSALKPSESKFQKITATHFATNTPTFNEAFLFLLESVWKRQKNYRLYVALVADEVVCSDGTGCIGVFSIGIDEIVNKKGAWGDSWWLLSQSDGLQSNSNVVKKVEFTTDGSSLMHVVVKGRAKANNQINGVYYRQPGMHNQHYIYKHEKTGLWMCYHSKRGAWTIGDSLASRAPIAFVDDGADSPNMIKNVWQVFSRERRFVDGGVDKDDAKFELDDNVSCQIASQEDIAAEVQTEDSPAFEEGLVSQGRLSIATKFKQAQYFAGQIANPLLTGNTAPLTVKAQNIVRWLASEQQYLETLRNLNICRVTFFDEASKSSFSVLPQMMNNSQLALEELRIAQLRDPNFSRPIGLLMIDIFPMIAEPVIDYCTALDIKLERAKKEIAKYDGMQIDQTNPAAQSLVALGGVSGVMNGLSAPFLQVQRYQHYILAIQKACLPNDKDQGPLFVAWQKFSDLAAQVVKIAGKLELNAKPKPKLNTLPPPLVLVTKEEADTLFQHPYYHGELSRQQVLELYNTGGKQDGWFLVRKKSVAAGPGAYFLSYGAEGRLVHTQVELTNGKFVLGREFSNLNSLVLYYGSPRTNLKGAISKPCPRIAA